MPQDNTQGPSSLVELITRLDIQTLNIEGYDELAHRVTIDLNLVDDIDKIDQLTRALKLKNAEKYAEQIATLIAEDTDYICKTFCKGIDFYGGYDCGTCPVNGICNSAKKLEEWLLEESKS